MKVAVTGGSGFIGSLLVEHLEKAGHEVVSLDVRKPRPSTVQCHHAIDVRNSQAVANAFIGCEAVYHLAGPLAADTLKSPAASLDVQVCGTMSVLEAALEARVEKFILASSVYVYQGLSPDMEANEATPLDMARMNLFAAQKAMAECLVRTYAARSEGRLKCVILRIGSAYGGAQGSNAVAAFVHAAVRGAPIEVWGSGDRTSQFTFVLDIVEGCAAALRSEGQVFNLVSPEETSYAAVAATLGGRFGVPIVHRDAPEPTPFPYISSRRAIRDLGWQITPFADGLNFLISEVEGSELRNTPEHPES
jgi:UDP-glucose 4-epimerase